MFIPMVAIKIHDRKSFYLFSINIKYTQNSGQFYLITPRRNLRFFPFSLRPFNFAMLSLESVATEISQKISTKDGIKEF